MRALALRGRRTHPIQAPRPGRGREPRSILSRMPRTRPRRSDPRFLVEDFEPAYLDVFRRGELEERVEAGLAELAECRACPRNCAIDRLAGDMAIRRLIPGGEALCEELAGAE